MFTWFSKVIKKTMRACTAINSTAPLFGVMGWFIFSEVMFSRPFSGALYYVRNFAVPWLGGEGEKEFPICSGRNFKRLAVS